MRVKFILIILAVAAIAGVIFFDVSRSVRPLDIPRTETPATTTAIVLEKRPALVQQTPAVVTRSAATSSPETTPAPAPNFTLSASGSLHTAFASTGTTVLDAMKILASTSNFVFTGRDYPSLGFFVESIDGKKAESGHNWIFYVNGKLSGTGASQTTLKAGDAVEWRYEKNY